MNIITSGLPYANGALHIGHLYEWFISDSITRLSRLGSDPLHWVCGDDAHGVAVLNAARLHKTEPNVWVNGLTTHRKHFLSTLPFLPNTYSSTVSAHHHQFVQKAYQLCEQKGLIVFKDSSQYFYNNIPVFERDVVGQCPHCNTKQFLGVCEVCQASLEAGDLLNPVYSSSGQTLELKNVELAHFNWGVFRDVVKNWIKDHAPLNLRQKIINDVENVPDLWCIERPGDYFGVKIPNRSGHFYVWFDALLGYYSFAEQAGYSSKNPFTHVLGKDILTFHAIRLPALCAALDLPLPKSLIIHGHIVDENRRKFSKSLGNAPDLNKTRQRWGDDVLRYYFLKGARGGVEDIPFDPVLIDKTQTLLANVIGNTYRRLHKISNGTASQPTAEQEELLKRWDDLAKASLLTGNVAQWIEYGETLINNLVSVLQQERWWEGHKDVSQNGFSYICQILIRLECVLPTTLKTIVDKIRHQEKLEADDVFFSKV